MTVSIGQWSSGPWLRYAALLALAPWLIEASAQPQDTTTWSGKGGWRLGVFAAATSFLTSSDAWSGDWLNASDLGRGMAPHVHRKHGELKRGWKRPPVLGIMVRNNRADEWGLTFMTYDAAYRPRSSSYVSDVTARNWTMRLEFTRSGSPHPKEQRPRFGFRYGCALQVGYGTAQRRALYSPTAGSSSFSEWVGSTMFRLQPTLQFGYRSRLVHGGVQMHINALTFASGGYSGLRRFVLGSQQEEVHYSERIRAWDLAYKSLDEGILLNAIQLYLSVPLFRLASQD